MSDGKTFAVAMIGIPEQERNVLKNIFKLSLYRAYTYTLVSVEEPSQILIVDADDSNAMAEWSALTNKSAAQSPAGATSSRTPTVMVSKDPPANGAAHYLRRPFIATRVFGVLDQVAAQAPSAAPEKKLTRRKMSVPDEATPASASLPRNRPTINESAALYSC